MSTVHWRAYMHYPPGVNTKEYDRASITVLDPHKMIGRHTSNNDTEGTSWMHLRQYAIEVEGDHAVHEQMLGPVICLLMHYSCSFGHTIQGLLSSLTHYMLHGGEHLPASTPVLHVQGNTHLLQLNSFVAEMLGRPLLLLHTGTEYLFSRVHFFRPVTHVHASQVLAVERLRAYVRAGSGCALFPKHIAILKSTAGMTMNNPCGSYGHLVHDVVDDVLQQEQVTLLTHHMMHVRTLLQYLVHCESLVTCWGATAAWHLFLRPPQRCLLLQLNAYRCETTDRHHRANYDREVFPNVSLTVHQYDCALPHAQRAQLQKEIHKLVHNENDAS